ncbi:hypothetical protein DNTS_028909 [Danionella cerebrum]|uniref:Uncharacterized protein n=1 Tax=Danionella cerebrum TaxID=2873325 RepID=A0A553N4W4_9TELE|nr:hypothetical protein DNTS_028909 [Danionella translucida]
MFLFLLSSNRFFPPSSHNTLPSILLTGLDQHASGPSRKGRLLVYDAKRSAYQQERHLRKHLTGKPVRMVEEVETACVINVRLLVTIH